ncbi:MAG TPA: DUF1828 domain-containing protein [Ignavibacteriaceae bacterium]|jgi:uncharacterized protein YlxP (DUF503 family)|nr:MAG: hypothetical protein BWY38_01156 [Ignavibacteria bacterium ADurb.Bin266]OQY74808.1 MAG: hypothetical protein B6D44_03285 [Ignavibacteriales bacterium UTCHB2]HQF43511.1 DUF1828 domain-containing protein [Ignavibacteriaceae bacterium]HQI40803.1 DUF1828 domain-containing protein [Ignavibacteriaceae bacterium]HQJ46058.1 DUF1828 domain-containing protein [Ignavibacteriaceae bacterium]
MNWIDELIEDYFKFLKSKTIVQTDEQSGWSVVSTPFLGLFNDTIELFIKKINGKILLSDDGRTFHNLDLVGTNISRSPKRRDILDKVLLNYGVSEKENELIIEADEKNFPQRKYNLLAAIIEINDLYTLAKHTIASIFKEDVKEYLDTQEIVYTPQFISKGSTGLEFTFDFQIAYKKKEIVIKAFNNINKLNLPNFLFSWEDIKSVRETVTQKKVLGLAVINNEERQVRSEYLEALISKGADYILWTDRFKKDNLNKILSNGSFQTN